jgi:molybdopterin-guanine dinucleotide biosynthesis protein A
MAAMSAAAADGLAAAASDFWSAVFVAPCGSAFIQSSQAVKLMAATRRTDTYLNIAFIIISFL